MSDIANNLEQVRNRIQQAAEHSQRLPEEIVLIAVSKTKPVSALREAIAVGQKVFGESYLQEALEKIEQLQDEAIEWHFVGPIQSNKTRPIAENFDWVHSVEREKIAARLSEQRPAAKGSLNMCIQVNISEEGSKSGVLLDDLQDLVGRIKDLPNITLRGLMAIPLRSSDPQQQRAAFKRLADALQDLNEHFGLRMDTLSMGMSGDLEAAVAEGATMVRIGTDIFGERERPKQSN